MTGTIKLHRTIVGIGRIELRRGTFDAFVDGDKVGSIEWHQSVELPVAPGRHTLRMRKGRGRSKARTFVVADGDVMNFRCHGANLWPIWLASFVVPSLAISLRPE